MPGNNDQNPILSQGVPVVSDNTYMDNNQNVSSGIGQSNISQVTPSGAPQLVNDNVDQVESINSPHVPKKYGGKKIIATIFVITFLIVGVTAGVLLVQRQQEISERAASGSECDQSPDCILLDNSGNSGSFTAPRSITRVDITARYYHEYFPGDTDDGCYKVSIQGRNLSWERIGSGPDCKDVSNVQVWMGDESTPTPTIPTSTPTDGPTNTPTNTPTGTITVTPTQPPTKPTAECSQVKAFNTSWVEFTQEQLNNLREGDRIRFTVYGNTSEGTFDKARFIINGDQKDPVSTKRPGTEEFYYEYVIPSGVTSFTVDAQIHHSTLGWF